MAEYDLELYVRDEFTTTEPDGTTATVRLAVPFIRDSGKKILIDFGNPKTICAESTLHFCGADFRIDPAARAMPIRLFREQLRTDIDVILGMDIIMQYTVVLDYRAKTCRFEKTLPAEFQNERYFPLIAPAAVFPRGFLPNGNMRELPLVAATVGGMQATVGLDTGASIAYMRLPFRNGAPKLASVSDFNTCGESYITEVFRLTVCIGDEQFKEHFGVPTENTEKSFQLLHVDGMLGFDFFNTFITALDYQNRRIYYKRVK